MLVQKNKFIVGLTTYNNENLAISVPGLARLQKKFVLIIFNDNPETKIKQSDIRRLGYRGKLHIINTKQNQGLCRARLEILDYVRTKHIKSDWFIFVDDDDVLLTLDAPRISEKHFAVIQNMAVIRTRLCDVLRVMKNPNDFTIDDENVYLVRPHVGLAGTVVKTGEMLRMGDILNTARNQITEIDESLDFRAPTDMMMWSALNIVSRHDKSDTTPIYMDKTNYLATDLDTATTKYGKPVAPSKNAQKQILQALNQYDAVVRDALDAAAPAGQE